MFSEADFPLNHRGAVYHLDLLPEELGDWVITVGDPSRVNHVSQYLDRVELQRSNREFVSHTGRLGNKRVTVMSTGIGMSNIDIVINELDALVNIDLASRRLKEQTRSLNIIRIGTTGSLQTEAATGEVVASDFALGFSELMDFYQVKERHQSLLEAFEAYGHYPTCFAGRASRRLFDQFKSLGISGMTVSCSGFYGPQARQLRLPVQYPDLVERLAGFSFQGQKIMNMEMETAALYALGENLGHHCLSLNLVIDSRVSQKFAENIEQMMDNFIAKVMERLA